MQWRRAIYFRLLAAPAVLRAPIDGTAWWSPCLQTNSLPLDPSADEIYCASYIQVDDAGREPPVTVTPRG
ncbi:hypothetical protein VTK26DRAFT_9160 [Humicola hyalothermophila]